MKKVLLLSLFVALATVGFAQKGYGDYAKKTPEERAQMRTDRMTKALELNQDQIKKVSELNEKQAKEIQTIMQKDKEEREERMTDAKKRRETYNNKMEKILTPDQWKKFQDQQAKRKEKFEAKGKQHKGKHHDSEKEAE